MNLTELGSLLRVSEVFIQTVNGEHVGYLIPSTVIAEQSWPARLNVLQRLNRVARAGLPTIEQYTVNGTYRLEVTYYPYYVTLRLLENDDARI